MSLAGRTHCFGNSLVKEVTEMEHEMAIAIDLIYTWNCDTPLAVSDEVLKRPIHILTMTLE